ncbi:MAG: class I SAM-dependent methyltransferase [Mycobacteriales bacterium]|nr:class I SAM-dependent methyltransferase [Frankia sp.]
MLTTCTACGGTLRCALPAVTDTQTGGRFEIWRCVACGLGHTLPVPTDVAAYYGADYHGGRHGATGGLALRRRMRVLRQAAGRGNGRRLIDVGCGDGAFLVAATRAGWQVAGTELAPDEARHRGLRVEADLPALADFGPVDVVTMWHSLEHLPNPAATLLAIAALAAPDALLVVAVPNAGGAAARAFGRHWLHLDPPRHLYHFTATALHRLLRRSGFVPVRSWAGEIEYDVIGWSQSALNAVTRRPNVFFDVASRRPRRVSRAVAAAHTVAGAALSALALPIVAARAAAHRADTLVVAAQRRVATR